eukprot:jgi/Astpho2/8406/Aster-x1497
MAEGGAVPQMLMSHLASMGAVQKIRTGNTTVDVLLCMLLPLLLARLASWLQAAWEQLQGWLRSGITTNTTDVVRIIQHEEDGRDYSGDPDAQQNWELQKAVLVWIGNNKKLAANFQQAELQLMQAHDHSRQDKQYRYHGEDHRSDTDFSNGQQHCHLDHHFVITAPPCKRWVQVGPNVQFRREVRDRQEGHGLPTRRRTQTIFTLQSSAPNGAKLIDDFVGAALAHYKALMATKKEDARYLYTPVQIAGHSEADKVTFFKQYRLSETKTFASFFHPQKEALLQLLNHFQHKTGKFGIAGYPDKLGLLLHGPPGTGKTSLIKALAHHTGRSLVSVSLAAITTNQELFDLMNSCSYPVSGSHRPNTLGFGSVIFILEDVDAACDIVGRRARLRPTPVEDHVPEDTAEWYPPRGEATDGIQQNKEGGRGRGRGGGRGRGRGRHNGHRQRFQDGAADNGHVDSVQPGAAGPVNSQFLKASWENHDALNLAGLLNVLDGVIDTPRRMIVLTTNHPERLDPALIRPGRINKMMYMGLLEPKEALQMLRHYFPDGTSAQEERFTSALHCLDRFSPATLEAKCAEAEDVDHLIDLLQAAADPGSEQVPCSEEVPSPPGCIADVSLQSTEDSANEQVLDCAGQS